MSMCVCVCVCVRIYECGHYVICTAVPLLAFHLFLAIMATNICFSRFVIIV